MVRPNCEADFWRKVDRSKGPNECWPWLGFRAKNEGRFSLKGKLIAAHIAAYRYAVGSLPKGTNISHSCNDRYCCNPAHLIPFQKYSAEEQEARSMASLIEAVDKSPEGCWLFTKYKNAKGYGLTNYRGKTVSAHRLMWRLRFGPIPPGKHIRHICDTPACINPDHLLLGSHADNMADRKERKRYFKAYPKLTPAQVRSIRLSTDTTTALARKYAVREATIRMARTGRTWRKI